jgi:hypothetical protein
MKKPLNVVILLLSIFLLQGAAQNNLVAIDLRLFEQVKDSRVFYIGDIDFLKQGGGPNLFILTLENHQGSVEAQLHFQLRLNGITIAEVFSEPFLLPSTENSGPIIITYNNLVTGTAIIPTTGEAIELMDYDLYFERVPNLETQITATGKLPAGQYLFFIELLTFRDGVPTPTPDENFGDNILTVTNPTTLELIYPGEPAGSENISTVPSLFPYFLWQSDALEFNITVYEKLSEDSSIQDVLSHDPILRVEGFPNQLFQFPSDPSPEFVMNDPLQNGYPHPIGPVRLLEYGKIYYWNVEAVVISATGETLLTSEVYQFKTIDQEGMAPDANLLLIYLRQILGDRYETYMKQLNASPTGNILLNGTPVEIEVLVDLINKLNQKKAEIQNISIEY